MYIPVLYIYIIYIHTGVPNALEVKVDTVINKNKIVFSMSGIDRNSAPARYIIVDHIVSKNNTYQL